MSQHTTSTTPLMTTDEERQRILNRLRRLEGQVRGLQMMIDSGKDCESVLTQVMAAKSALNQVGLLIIGHSMKTCLLTGEAETKDELVDQALSVLLRYVNLPETWSEPAQD
jgi:CsoR family transcriptional regulator, copper-sensing transcriptional repressor